VSGGAGERRWGEPVPARGVRPYKQNREQYSQSYYLNKPPPRYIFPC